MHRYWMKFDIKFGEWTDGLLLGCGVTADDIEQAKRIVSHVAFRTGPMPKIISIIEDVQVCDLDSNHVLPNVADPTRAGVWYPAYAGGQNPSVIREALAQ